MARDLEPEVSSNQSLFCVRRDVTEGIRFADTPTVVDQQLGGNCLLQCVARGTPQPEVSWRFGGKRIVPGIGCCYCAEKHSPVLLLSPLLSISYVAFLFTSTKAEVM